MTKILFVCHGNICRSPMAEFVMKDMIRKRGVSDLFEIASAATSREEIGNGVHHGTQRKLKEMGWVGQSSLNLCRDNVYVVCLTPQGDVSDMDSKFMGMLSRHIWEQHGVRTAWHLDENIQGVRVYRLRKTWFQPGRKEAASVREMRLSAM